MTHTRTRSHSRSRSTSARALFRRARRAYRPEFVPERPALPRSSPADTPAARLVRAAFHAAFARPVSPCHPATVLMTPPNTSTPPFQPRTVLVQFTQYTASVVGLGRGYRPNEVAALDEDWARFWIRNGYAKAL